MELVVNYLKSVKSGSLEPSNLKNNLIACLDINKIYSLIVLSFEMQKICTVDVKQHLRENS